MREVIVGLILSAAVMGAVLFFVFSRPTSTSKVAQSSTDVVLSASRSGPPEPPVVYVGQDLPAELPTPSDVAPPIDEYEPPPRVLRRDGSESTGQVTRVMVDGDDLTKIKPSGPKAYIESATLNIARLNRDANVSARVVLVNIDTRPLVRYRLMLEVNGFRTTLSPAPGQKPMGVVRPSSSIDLLLAARTLLSDSDLRGRKRILLDAWFSERDPSVKDSLVISEKAPNKPTAKAAPKPAPKKR